ncbi:MAG: hypothetical protein LBS83_03730 [Holosporales bacterium]|jgi:hypothetical protein|nr:hypothetical protein [Holosporales bacterium]
MKGKNRLIVLSVMLGISNLNAGRLDNSGFQLIGDVTLVPNGTEQIKDRMAGSKREKLEISFDKFKKGILSYWKRKCGGSNWKLLRFIGKSVSNFPSTIAKLNKNERSEIKEITDYMLGPPRSPESQIFFENLLKCNPEIVKNVLKVISDKRKLDHIEELTNFDVKNGGRGYSVLNEILGDEPSEDLRISCNFFYSNKMFERNKELEKKVTHRNFLAALLGISTISIGGILAFSVYK